MAADAPPPRTHAHLRVLRPLVVGAASRLRWFPGVDRAVLALTSLGMRTGVLPYEPAAYTQEPWATGATGGDLDYIAGIGEVFRYSLLLGYISYFGGRPRILDVGCGKGHLRARMAGLDFAAYVGVDRSAMAIAEAMAMADDRTSFVVGDVVIEEVFDAIVCNEILYYFDDPASFLDQASDHLSPGGLLLTSMWRHGVDDYLWGLIDRRFERIDLVEVRNPASRIARRGWRVACHRRR